MFDHKHNVCDVTEYAQVRPWRQRGWTGGVAGAGAIRLAVRRRPLRWADPWVGGMVAVVFVCGWRGSGPGPGLGWCGRRVVDWAVRPLRAHVRVGKRVYANACCVWATEQATRAGGGGRRPQVLALNLQVIRLTALL